LEALIVGLIFLTETCDELDDGGIRKARGDRVAVREFNADPEQQVAVLSDAVEMRHRTK
jgi:hypothetical protein